MNHTSLVMFAAWYSKNPRFTSNPQLTPENLTNTHVKVKDVLAHDPEEVFQKMQGENWSPNGEARPLITSLGLSHTSMSMGDVVQLGDQYWEVIAFGFRKL